MWTCGYVGLCIQSGFEKVKNKIIRSGSDYFLETQVETFKMGGLL